MTSLVNFSHVHAVAAGQWQSILVSLGIDAEYLRDKHGPCPACGGHDRFRFDDKDGTGSFICNQCGAGDGFKLLQKVHGCTAKEALHRVAGFLGVSADESPSTAEIDAHRKRSAENIAKQAAADLAERERLATDALALFNAGQHPPFEHDYLLAKGLTAQGDIRLTADGKTLLIPLYDYEGKLWAVERIFPEGNKWEKKYFGKTRGCSHVIAGTTDKICIVEGYATGLSVHLATGRTVYCAMSAMQMMATAEAARQKHPTAIVTLCADDDAGKAINTGLDVARAAALAADGLLAIPNFGMERPDDVKDFDDLRQHQGHEAVRTCVEAAAPVLPESSVSDTTEPETQEALIVRLAGLSDLAYFQVQGASAAALGISPGNLNTVVRQARQKLTRSDASEGGSALLFEVVEPWPKPVNGSVLLDELVQTLRRYVVCERHTAEAAALWLAFTWLIDAVSVAPIANITAPLPNCGKSTLLDLFERLSFRPLKADNISAAALFRSVEKWRPTLLIDEVDAFLRDNEDARGILNSGHKRNGYVLRVVGDDHEPRRFSTWGPKALCGIGSIAATLQSRSIRLELRRKLPGETVENLRHIDDALVERLQQQLARFAEDSHATVKAARPVPVVGLSNRSQDNWEPLLAIADAAGGAWPDRARRAAIAITGLEAAQEQPDTNAELLADIREAFELRHADKLPTADLLDALCADEEKPWSTWNRGKRLGAHQLAKRLREFGITVNTIRIGNKTPKGYELAKFQDAFKRYLGSDSPSNPQHRHKPDVARASADFESATEPPVLRIEKPLEASDDAGCGGVAVPTPCMSQKTETGWEAEL